jgi:hypothetical protein
MKADLERLSQEFIKLNHTFPCPIACMADIWGTSIPSTNEQLAHYYTYDILRFKHVLSHVLKVPEIMEVVDIIYKYMQLYERLINKQREGDRVSKVLCNLKLLITIYENLATSAIVRLWNHPKASFLTDFHRKAVCMYKMNFVIRRYSV